MIFDEVLAQTLELLQREGRVSYRALKRRFSIDDEYLEDLKTEIIRAKRLATDEDSAVLVWTGSRSQTPTSSGPRAPEIGESGAAPATISHEGERRQLTVMFCDLVGSTPLSQQFDPEELRDLILPYQHACSEVIAQFNGHIAKYLGDGVLAYFGYPHAHEDDAQRALRAALRIVAALQRLNAEQGRLPVVLKVRIGIHTGLVVVGEMGGREFREQAAIVGDTPNTAARLQEIADPDTAAISAATYQLVRGLFDCEPLGPRALKGLSIPVQVYRVLHETGAQSRFDVAMQVGLTPLVGRENESGILNERWERSRIGEGQVMLLSGEPGIGKSRLVQAFKEQIEGEPHRWLESHCSPYHQNSALRPIIDLLQRALAFQSDDESLTKIERLEHGLGESGLSLNDYVPLLASLLSLPVPEKYPRLTLTLEAQKEKTHEAIQSWLLTVAQREVVVLVFEDLHWADPSTRELLGHLLDQAATARLLVVLTYRPEFAPPWSGRSHFATITLGRLLRPQSEGMVKNLTGGKALPPQVLDQIIAKTDGVPLFVEELTRMVLESDLVREQDGHYELAGPLPPLAIPSTLQDSLNARLDRLGSAREVAQLAATIGRDFSYELVRAISPTDDSALQKALAMLVEAEVLYRRGLPTQARYFFKHALIRDAAYESLLKSKRQQIHSRIAHVLQEQFRELAASQPEIVAHHFTEARLLTEAIPFWQKAGQQALQRSAFVESINHLSRALSLLPEWIGGSTLDHQQKQSGEARGGLLLALAQAQARGGQHLKARQTLLQAAEIAQVISSADLAVSVASHLIRLSFEVGIPVTATATRLLSETLERIGPQDSPLRVMTLAGLASALAYAGASDRAIACAQEGAAVARRLGPYIVNDPGGFGHRELLEMVSSAMIQALQAPEHAHQRLIYVNEMLESAKYASEEHDPRGFSLTYAGLFWWRVYSELQLGDVANTKRDIAEYARLADALKQPLELCISRHFQACEASIEGRFEDCERLAHDALAIGQSFETENAAGVFGMQMFTLRREQDRLREIEPLLRHFVQTPEGARAWRPGLAVIYSELRRIEEARSEFEQLAQRDFTDLSRDANWLVSMTYLADVCTFLGDAVRAEKLYKLILPCRAINVLIANGSASYGSVARYLGKLATTMRRWDEAERHFEEALAMNAAMDARPWLAHTQYHYACMLLSRDRAGDSGKAAPLLRDALATARELGMLALEQRIASGSP